MADPIITNVSPATVSAWGGEIVSIAGSGFGPRVVVLMGGAMSESAGVKEGSEEVLALTPHGEPGAADVEVRNLDDEGVPTGEFVVAADAIEYERPSMLEEGGLATVMRALIRLFNRELLLNGVGPEAVAVDYDDAPDDGARTVLLAEVPSLTISGPRLEDSRERQRRELRHRSAGGDYSDVLGVTLTQDLVFGVMVATRSKVATLNLQELVLRALHRNRTLATPDGARWPMRREEFAPARPRDGLHVASMDLRIVGFHVDEGVVLHRTRPVDTIEQDISPI